METKTLYHGTGVFFEEFSTDCLCTKCSIDQYGSGFYFFDSPAPTMRYGNIIMECSVSISKILDYKKVHKIKMNRTHVERLILTSPNLEEKLNNINDVEYYGFDKVLKEAINLYIKGDIVYILNCIGNDFFDPRDTHILLSKFTEFTGYDCICDKERGIYNILTKRQINVVRHATLEDYE